MYHYFVFIRTLKVHENITFVVFLRQKHGSNVN